MNLTLKEQLIILKLRSELRKACLTVNASVIEELNEEITQIELNGLQD